MGEQESMAKLAAETLQNRERALYWAEQVAIVVGASLFVALCAKVTLPLPFTPVPLAMENFGVLLVGLALGSRRGFAALLLFLMEGAMGMPVFAQAGIGGIAQIIGPTGGFLIAYPFVAWLAGWIMERGRKTFARAAVAALLAECVLFAGGIGWLFVLTHSISMALRFGLYWFVFAEIIKVLMSSAIVSGWRRMRKAQS